ncbi:DUF2254 domain-containing protein [Salinibacterium sp. G-O1]|uniref:DUF2254 domain-containing protein n=1 Tax=Salinibacterium sp. G-O1 TaxID=3046208 RepID=UPI0024B922B5|nr:DUF2254 domain-containing protein [Salinibacterium sp. G-O1]MDJ0333797.1 DUF2254 domain-containing protein [Salinibacterium sp. G-O1]
MASAARGHRWSRRVASLRESISTELWPVPVFWIVIAVAAGVAIPILDRLVDQDIAGFLQGILFSGGAPAARAVLGAIAGSLITATSLTFSLTVVALQLASSQASPRLLRLFASDRAVHATLAMFLATFAFALTVLRTVRDETEAGGGFVPRIGVTVASVLTLASIVTLTLFLAHLSRQLRVETMLREVHDETSGTIALVSSTEPGDAVAVDRSALGEPHILTAQRSGFISAVDHSSLVDTARRYSVVFAEEHTVGSSVIAGTVLVSWWSDTGELVDADALQAAVNDAYSFEYERTAAQDVGFGIRQIADIASKALSPGVNDPTTAVHALSHLSAILGALTELPEQRPGLVDEDGNLRVIRGIHEFDDLLEVALQQPRRYGAGDPDVAARMLALLDEVGYVARTPGQREAVRAQLGRMVASIDAADYDPTERARFAGLAAKAGLTLAAHNPKAS